MRTRNLFLAFLLIWAAESISAEETPGRCISTTDWYAGLQREPEAVAGLEPLVSVPTEGFLKLHHETSDCCSEWGSPTGDLSIVAGPYDPENRHLYIWGYVENGWIEVNEVADTWLFGEKGRIRPRLYDKPDAHRHSDDVTIIRRSAVLGTQFYSGYTAPHWLTGRTSYQVFKVAGPEMTRIRELETGVNWYLGDDLVTGLAVFGPAGAVRNGSVESQFLFYDGTQIVTPPSVLPPIVGYCGR